MIPLLIVSLNTYLVPRPFNKNRNTFPEERVARIRHFMKDKHISFLQEVWGSSLEDIVDHDVHTTPTGRGPILSSSSFIKKIFPQFFLDTLHTLYLYGSGGLYDLSTNSGEHKVQCMYRRKHTFTISRSRSRKGVEATLWNIPQWGDHRQLLVFNTHLDPSWRGTKNRRQQISEILHFMDQTFNELATNQPGHQGDKGTQYQPQDWSKTGVLVLGDFNVKASSTEYRQVLQRPEWNDYFLGVDQHTYAKENSFVPNASSSSQQEQNDDDTDNDCGRIDYIFGVHQFGKYSFLSLECIEQSIPTSEVGRELSDHFPLVVRLVPKLH